MTRTLFDQPAAKRQRAKCPGKSCRLQIEKAVLQMLKRNPTCESVGEVLECIGLIATQLEKRMHD